MTKADLIVRMAKEAKISKAAAARALNTVTETITAELRRGGRLILPGFGTFSVGYRKARIGRSPRTGQRITIAATRAPKFHAGKELKEAVKGNGPPSGKSYMRELTYADRSKYVGGVVNGKRHGSGTYTWPSGHRYVGEWKDDRLHGRGTYTWSNGDKYVGEFKNSRASGGSLYEAAGRKIWSYQDSGGKWIFRER